MLKNDIYISCNIPDGYSIVDRSTIGGPSDGPISCDIIVYIYICIYIYIQMYT